LDVVPVNKLFSEEYDIDFKLNEAMEKVPRGAFVSLNKFWSNVFATKNIVWPEPLLSFISKSLIFVIDGIYIVLVSKEPSPFPSNCKTHKFSIDNSSTAVPALVSAINIVGVLRVKLTLDTNPEEIGSLLHPAWKNRIKSNRLKL
jgi:hypothetical protein